MKRMLFFLLYIGAVFAEDTYEFRGIHFFADYSECNHEALTDVNSLREAMLQAVNACGATLLRYEDFVFDSNGFTMVILLSESHASIHTYPEHNSCFIDVFTCGNKCSAERFDAVLKSYLNPGHVSHKTFIRDVGIAEQK